MKIEITKDDKTGEIEVWMNGRTTGTLRFGEMLEQVIRLLSPLPGPFGGYEMKTPRQWEMSRWKEGDEIEAAPQGEVTP